MLSLIDPWTYDRPVYSFHSRFGSIPRGPCDPPGFSAREFPPIGQATSLVVHESNRPFTGPMIFTKHYAPHGETHFITSIALLMPAQSVPRLPLILIFLN